MDHIMGEHKLSMIKSFARFIEGKHADKLTAIERARSQVMSWFVTITILLCVTLIFVNWLLGIYTNMVILLSAIVLYAPIILLNRSGKLKVSALYFVSVTIVVVVISSINAFKSGRFTDTENILYALFVGALFLFDDWLEIAVGIVVVIITVIVKAVKINYMSPDMDVSMILIMINVVILFVVLYTFNVTFKRVLTKTIADTDQQKKLLYTLIDNVPIYIGIFNARGQYSMVNVHYEAAFNKGRDEIIGKYLHEVIPQENVSKYQPMLEKALAGETVEFHLKTPMLNGKTIIADGKYVPVFDPSGNVQYVTVALYDVTRLEGITEELKRANEVKNKLFNIVAHDVRNPLNNFQILLNSSLDEYIEKKNFKKYVGALQQKFEPLKRTIDDLLEWSILQLDGLRSKQEKIDLSELGRLITDELRGQIKEKHLKVVTDFQEQFLIADFNHMQIVMRNLVHNAIKFTPHQGQITLSSFKTADGKISIKISDSGIGISRENLEKILQGDIINPTAGTSGEKGSGLGLTFCKELIEKNGAQLGVSSNENGTTFEIVFTDQIQTFRNQ